MKLKISLLCTMLAIFTTVTQAATLKVNWSNTDKYTDIRPSNEVKSSFHKRIFNTLNQHLVKLANKLPEQNKLEITFTNLDLAGNVTFGHKDYIRIVKEIYYPRAELSYRYLDSTGQVLKQGSVKIKDPSFMRSLSLRYQNVSLGYEKKMLDEWFEKTFLN